MVHVLADEDRERALALKIVQAMNNIHAAGALINQGYLYEWRAVERIALEGVQEILFLELGIDPGPWTKDHQQWQLAPEGGPHQNIVPLFPLP